MARKRGAFLVGAPSRRQQGRQRAAPHQLHRDEHPAVGQAAQLVDRDDPRVLELPADLRLLDEPADHLGMVAVLLPHHLDGQVAAEVEVAALEDRSHAPAGELADELISRGWVGMPVTSRAEAGRISGASSDDSRRWTRAIAGRWKEERAPSSRCGSGRVPGSSRRTRPRGGAGTGDRAPPGSCSADGPRSRDTSRPPIIAPAPFPFASDTESHLVFIR